MNMFANAVAFYAGIRLIEAGLTDLQPMFTVLMAVMTTANQMGRVSTFTSMFQKAKHSAINTFEILDRQPLIDPDYEGSEPKTIKGEVAMKDIAFSYPARPDAEIFKGNFEFQGKANTMIALVVSSSSLHMYFCRAVTHFRLCKTGSIRLWKIYYNRNPSAMVRPQFWVGQGGWTQRYRLFSLQSSKSHGTRQSRASAVRHVYSSQHCIWS